MYCTTIILFCSRVNPGFPDTRTCILHQKLQMLNCCIERKKAREQKEFSAARSDPDDLNSSEAESDDEFYDCDVDKEEDSHPKHSLWNKPVGRLSKHGNLKLINTGEQLYIPITQEPVPKTEDQLEEDTDVLLKLGEDELGIFQNATITIIIRYFHYQYKWKCSSFDFYIYRHVANMRVHLRQITEIPS